jgi:uncharacterized damage-inducible protein DinB
MIVAILKTLFNRDLKRLIAELEQYKTEADIWKLNGEIKNSAGNLCLHLVGNLNTYIGSVLGKSGYLRNRDLEFSLKDIPREELVQMVGNTINMINETFDDFDESNLEIDYPVLVFETKTTTAYFLVHLATHLSYHLGQVNYHRRLVGNNIT